MQKVIDFGKFDYSETGKKNNTIDIKIELKETDKGLVFTASGNVWNSSKSDVISCGQMIDDIAEFIGNDETYKTILRVWKLYHLNDMNAGTVEQSAALKDFEGDYTAQCKHLESINLLIDDGYEYGSAWLFREIPADDLEIIKSLF